MGYDRPILTERGPIEWDAACGDCDWHHSGTERRISALAYHHAADQHLRTVDGMDDDQRARMLPQHAGQLLRVLEVLRAGAQPSSAGVSRLQQLRESRVG